MLGNMSDAPGEGFMALRVNSTERKIYSDEIYANKRKTLPGRDLWNWEGDL